MKLTQEILERIKADLLKKTAEPKVLYFFYADKECAENDQKIWGGVITEEKADLAKGQFGGYLLTIR